VRIATLDHLADGPADCSHHAAQPDDLAVLFLTSGSTGDPKAVRITHRQLLDHCASGRAVYSLSDRDVALNWMPLEHAASLVMMPLRFHAVAAGQVYAPTALGLEDPLRWFDWVDRYRATVTWAPNFAFALVADRHAEVAARRWDLSCVRVLKCGGEAIVAET